MKLLKIIPALAVSFAIQGLAYPNVGDKVEWTGTVNGANGKKIPVRIIKEVTNYNQETKKWTVKYEASMGKDVVTENTEVAELYSPKKFQEIVATCSAQGGVLEKVEAPPVGTYDTCKLTTKNPDGSIVEKWWGNIPFGVVSKNTKAVLNKKYKNIPDLNAIVAGL